MSSFFDNRAVSGSTKRVEGGHAISLQSRKMPMMCTTVINGRPSNQKQWRSNRSRTTMSISSFLLPPPLPLATRSSRSSFNLRSPNPHGFCSYKHSILPRRTRTRTRIICSSAAGDSERAKSGDLSGSGLQVYSQIERCGLAGLVIIAEL